MKFIYENSLAWPLPERLPLPLPEKELEGDFEPDSEPWPEPEPWAEPEPLTDPDFVAEAEPEGLAEREAEIEPEPEAVGEPEPGVLETAEPEPEGVRESVLSGSWLLSTKIISRSLDLRPFNPRPLFCKGLARKGRQSSSHRTRKTISATPRIVNITMAAMSPPDRPLDAEELAARTGRVEVGGGAAELVEAIAFRQAWVGLPEQLAVGNQILVAPAFRQLAWSFVARQPPGCETRQHAPVDVDCEVIGQTYPGRSYSAVAPKADPMFSQTVCVNEPVP